MQVPLTPPESGAAVLRQREIAPASPVSPVQGAPDEAARVDPGVALQWTQPAFKGDGSAEARGGTARQQSQMEAQAKGWSPLTSLLSGSSNSSGTARAGLVQAYLPSSASVASLVGAASQPQADAEAPPLPWPMPMALPASGQQQASAGVAIRPTLGSPSGQEVAATVKPEAAGRATSTDSAPEGKAQAAVPAATWQALMRAVQSSDAFAASRLRDVWWGRADPSQPLVPDASTLARWVDALDPQSEPAKQATRMLLEGQMQWQGELAPGWPARIVREDAWREHPARAGELEKGASLRLEVTMPRAGRLQVTASQWGQEVDVKVRLMPESTRTDSAYWEQAWSDLHDQLASQGVRVSTALVPHLTSAPSVPPAP